MDPKPPNPKCRQLTPGQAIVIGLSIGVGIGTSLGAALHNPGAGLALGVGIGVAMAAAFRARCCPKP